MCITLFHRRGQPPAADPPDGPMRLGHILASPPDRCSLCGAGPVVAWLRAQSFGVCHGCALDALPRLMGAALVGSDGCRPGSVARGRLGLGVVVERFWEGFNAATAEERGGRR
jgi:hypothetical protein